MQLFDLLTLNLKRALVFIDAVAVKDANFNNSTCIARRHAQRRVTNVRGFLTEDRAKQFLFRRHRALTFRRDLTNQNITGFHLSTDSDNARLVKVAQRFLTDVWNIARNFFRPQLGITGRNIELFKVDRCVDVIAHDAL